MVAVADANPQHDAGSWLPARVQAGPPAHPRPPAGADGGAGEGDACSLSASVWCACGPGHLGASQTCCRLPVEPHLPDLWTIRLRSVWLPGALGRAAVGGRPGRCAAGARLPSRLRCRQPGPYVCARPGAIGTQRSRSLPDSTTRIRSPTRNGHAPPFEGSRKSSRSVNPHHVLTW